MKASETVGIMRKRCFVVAFPQFHLRLKLSVTDEISNGCEEFALQISGHSFSSTGKHVAVMNEESDCRLFAYVVSSLTNPLSTNVLVQGNLLRSHNPRFEELPEDMQVIKESETVGILRMISFEQCFVTFHDVVDGFGTQLFEGTTTISRRRSWKRLENCPKYVRKLSLNACTWDELFNLIIFGL